MLEPQARSNRTFMELKYRRAMALQRYEESSNRTFMELKLLQTPQTLVLSQF